MECSFDISGVNPARPELSSSEVKVYNCLDLRPKHLETILEECSLTFAETLGVLIDLELKGYIKEAARNYYYADRL